MYKDFFFSYVELKILEYVLFSVTNRCFSGSDAVKNKIAEMSITRTILMI